jgi:hypothetical protein
VKAAALLALASTFGAPAPSPESAADTVNFGPFTLTEVQIEDAAPRSPDAQHAQLRLQFSTDDPQTTAALVDDGAMLAIEVRSRNCGGGGTQFLAYQGRVGEPRLFDKLLEFTRLLYESGCGLRPETVRSHLRQLRLSRTDFAAGVQAMKERATVLFGGWRRRCHRPKVSQGMEELLSFLSSSPHDPCRGGTF